MKMTFDPMLATEAKALVALALRNGPIETLHAGGPCPHCNGKAEISHISDEGDETRHEVRGECSLSPVVDARTRSAVV